MSPSDTAPADDLDPYVSAIGSTSPQAILTGEQDKERRRRFNVTTDTALDYFSEPTRFQQSPHTGTGDLGIQNYAKEAGDQYEDLIRRRAPEFADQVPQARQKFEAQLFAAQQKAKLDYWRDQYANADETTMGTIRRLAIPGAARVTRIQFEKNARAADEAIQNGTANEDAYRELAAYHRLAQLSEDHPFKEAIYSLPSIVGEYAAGGKVLGALGKVTPGLGWLAPEAAAPASLLGKGAVALGRGIGLTATVPGAAIEAAASKGSLTDLKNLGPALAHEVLQNSVFGSLSEIANLPGGSFTNRLQRIAAKTGVGIAEQQAIDVIGKAVGLQTRYGLMQDILEGKSGDALKNLGVQVLNFGAISALHSGDPAKVNKVLQEQLQKSAARGDSAQQTGETFGSVLQAVQATYNEAAKQNPNASPAELAKLIAPNLPEIVRQALPTGPRRAEAAEFAKQVLSKSFDIKDAEWEVAASKEPLRLGYRPSEKPAAAPEKPTGVPFAPDVTQPLRAGVPGQLLEEGGPERPVGPFERLSPDEVVQLAKQLTGKELRTPQALVKELARRGLSPEGINQLSEATAKTAASPQAPETPPSREVTPEAPQAAPTPAEAPEVTPGPPVIHYPEYDPNHPLWAPKETPTEATAEEESPHPAALAFQRAFPGMEVTASGQLRATVGEGDHSRDVFLREGDTPNTVRLDFTHTKLEAQGRAGPGIEPGTLDLTRSLLKFAGELKGTGTNLEYVAKRGLSEKYAKALDRAGWEQVSGPTGEGTGLRVWKPKAETGQVPIQSAELSHITTTSRNELLDRMERGEGNLTPAESEVLKERLLWATGFRDIGDALGVSHEQVRLLEKSGLRKLGHSGSVDELHAANLGNTAIADVENGKNVSADELHRTDPNGVIHNARINQISDAIDELDRLDRQEAKERKSLRGKQLPPERVDYYRGRRRGLRHLIDEGQGEARPLEEQPGEAPVPPGQPAQLPGETPLRPASGGGLPEGAASPETGAPSEGTPAEPGQAAGPAVELPHQATPAEAAAAPGRPSRRDQLAAARAAKTKSVAAAIKGMGGLSEKGAEALGIDVQAAKEAMPSVFQDKDGKKGTLDLEDVLREAEKEGWIRDAKAPHAGEELLDYILNGAKVMDAGMDAALKRSEAAYLEEQERVSQEAAKAGHPAAEIAESRRSSEAAGYQEGQDRGSQEEATDVHAEFTAPEAPAAGGAAPAAGAAEPTGEPFPFGANEPGLGGALGEFLSGEAGAHPLSYPFSILRAVGQKAAQYVDALKATFAPAARGKAASEAAGTVRENNAELARKSEIAHEALKAGKALFDRINVNDRPAAFSTFVDAIEEGRINDLPENVRPIAQAIRDLTDARTEQLLQRGLLQNFIENYFGHLWKRRGTPASDADSDAIGREFAARRPLTGPESYRKQRSIPSYKEGIEQGLEPRSWNPVEIALLKLREMDRSIFGRDTFNELKENDLVKFFRLGESLTQGWQPFNDRLSTVFAPKAEGGAGPQLVGRYAAPEQVATLLNNHLSPGLQGNAIYDSFRGLGNLLNQFQLGFSAFHAGFVTMDTQVSAAALGLQQISRGEVFKGLGNILASPLAPIRAWLQGSKMLREYYNPGSQGAETAALMDALIKGGGRARMDAFYGSGHIEAFRNALADVRAGDPRKVGSLLWHALPALGEAVSYPIMNQLVPRMKLGVFADLARAEMERLGPRATPEAARQAFGRAWDSVENRLGQLTYDNVFWNRTLKDVLMAGVRSVGWNLGTIRELGGGLLDVTKGFRAGLTPRTGYLLALPMVAGLYGAVYQKLATGQNPDDLKDYFFPKTGRRRPDGTADRVALPSYIRDIAALSNRGDEGPLRWVQNAATMAKGKINPGAATVSEMLFNEDFHGAMIRNPNDTAVIQSRDTALHLLRSFESFSWRSFLEGRQGGATTPQALQGLVGVTPAQAYVTRTNAQQRAIEAKRKITLAPLYKKLQEEKRKK